MVLSIIKVGNSKGLRLPKSILTEYQIEESVELKLKDGYIELRPSRKVVRENWEEAFRGIKDDKDDEMLIPDFFEDEDL